MDAAEALKAIGPGNRVFVGSACGEPQELVRAMTEFGDRLDDSEVIHVLTLGVVRNAEPEYAPKFRPIAFFVGGSVRDAVNEARADHTPVFHSQVPGAPPAPRSMSCGSTTCRPSLSLLRTSILLHTAWTRSRGAGHILMAQSH